MYVLANIDVWAVPVNTALLVILALLSAYAAKDRQVRKRDITDIKSSMGLLKRSSDDPGNEHPPDTGQRRRVTDKERRISDRVGVSNKADSEIEEDLPRLRGPQE